jgi:hypothetical protein
MIVTAYLVAAPYVTRLDYPAAGSHDVYVSNNHLWEDAVPILPYTSVQGVGQGYVLDGDDFPLFANAAIVTENEGPFRSR